MEIPPSPALVTDLIAYVQHKTECELRRGHHIVYPEPIKPVPIIDALRMEQGRLATGEPTATLLRTSSRESKCTCGLSVLIARYAAAGGDQG